jgi:hypothetical protein
MKMKCLFLYGCLFLCLGACQTPPEFSKTPAITLDRLAKFHLNKIYDEEGIPISQGRDSINISLNFKDGDGDLGLDQSDLVPPYYVNGKKTDYYNNFFIDMYVLKHKKWSKIIFDHNLNFNSQFQRFQKGDKKSPLKGTMYYNFSIDNSVPETFNFGYKDTLMFEVYILDRALNKSNTVTTDPVILSLEKP